MQDHYQHQDAFLLLKFLTQLLLLLMQYQSSKAIIPQNLENQHVRVKQEQLNTAAASFSTDYGQKARAVDVDSNAAPQNNESSTKPDIYWVNKKQSSKPFQKTIPKKESKLTAQQVVREASAEAVSDLWALDFAQIQSLLQTLNLSEVNRDIFNVLNLGQKVNDLTTMNTTPEFQSNREKMSSIRKSPGKDVDTKKQEAARIHREKRGGSALTISQRLEATTDNEDQQEARKYSDDQFLLLMNKFKKIKSERSLIKMNGIFYDPLFFDFLEERMRGPESSDESVLRTEFGKRVADRPVPLEVEISEQSLRELDIEGAIKDVNVRMRTFGDALKKLKKRKNARLKTVFSELKRLNRTLHELLPRLRCHLLNFDPKGHSNNLNHVSGPCDRGQCKGIDIMTNNWAVADETEAWLHKSDFGRGIRCQRLKQSPNGENRTPHQNELLCSPSHKDNCLYHCYHDAEGQATPTCEPFRPTCSESILTRPTALIHSRDRRSGIDCFVVGSYDDTVKEWHMLKEALPGSATIICFRFSALNCVEFTANGQENQV